MVWLTGDLHPPNEEMLVCYRVCRAQYTTSFLQVQSDAVEACDSIRAAAARCRDLQLEAEEADAPFIADELNRQVCCTSSRYRMLI